MEQVISAHAGNFRLYRRSLNSDRNIYEKLRNVLHDVQGVLRQQHSNVKCYVTGKFVLEKAHRLGIFTNPQIFLSTNPIATTRSRPIEELLEGAVWYSIK